MKNLYRRLDRLSSLSILLIFYLDPLFYDFTWGAGGSTAGATLELCNNAWTDCKIPTCMHITWYFKY